MRKTTLPFLVIAFFACGASSASFDCSLENLNSIEQKICNDPDLSEIDDLLSVFYKYAMAHSSNKQELKSAQRKWVKERNNCPNEYPCMANAYEKRINEFAVAANFTDPQNVTNPQLFTAVHALETSLADLPSCDSFEDINLDGKKELVCFPDCNGAPACSNYFFVSQEKNYRYLPELEMGSYDSLYIVQKQDDPVPTLANTPGFKDNTINGWRILRSTYGIIKDCYYEETFYAYSDGAYNKIFSQSLEAPFKGCEN